MRPGMLSLMKALYYVLLPSLLAFAMPALAKEAGTLEPLSFSGIYTFGWSGVKFGEMDFLSEEKTGHFRAETHIRTTGLLNLFAAHASHTTLKSALEEGGISTSPRTYETFYTTKKEPRHVKLVFARGGAVTEEIVMPPENRQKRPEVPAADKKAALDPLSFLLALRKGLHEALQTDKKQVSLRLFEGRRLMDTDFVIAGHATLLRGTQEVPVIRVIGRRKPVAGYTAKELASLKEGDPPVIAYFSDDGHLVPLRLEVPLPVGMLYAELMHSCEISAPCALKPQVAVPEK